MMQATRLPRAEQQELPLDECAFSSTIRLLDPNGRVFFHGGNVYRGIYDDRVAFVRGLFDKGIVDSLMQKQLLIGTHQTNLKLSGFGMILKHDMLDVVACPKEWSIESFRLAALTTIDLMKELHQHGLTLIDGHNRNVSMTPGGSMVWHDFGSIVEIEKGIKPALREILTNFYFPLQIYRQTGSLSLIRRLGMNCSQDEYARVSIPGTASLINRVRSLPGGKKLGRLLQKRLVRYGTCRLGPLGEIGAIRRRFSKECTNRASSRSLEKITRLRAAVQKIQIVDTDTVWGQYHSSETIESVSASTESSDDPRFQAIEDLVAEAKADRVLDLGANQGLFSHMAYRYCDAVISADYDERAVGKHVELLRRIKGEPRIYPVVLNAVEITQEEASRLRSHTVMALALTHHLWLTQRFPIAFIAKQLSSVTEKRLITEFMPNGLGGIVGPEPNPLPDCYTLENFLDAFREEFHSVRVVEYEQPATSSPRTLVVCDKHTLCSQRP